MTSSYTLSSASEESSCKPWHPRTVCDCQSEHLTCSVSLAVLPLQWPLSPHMSRVLTLLLQVEASQSMIRIVGLSATLPNYKDVAAFLGVSEAGLFYFDASYRPVPLAMEFIGATDRNIMACKATMDDICYNKVWLMVGREVGTHGQGHYGLQASIMGHVRHQQAGCLTEVLFC